MLSQQIHQSRKERKPAPYICLEVDTYPVYTKYNYTKKTKRLFHPINTNCPDSRRRIQ